MNGALNAKGVDFHCHLDLFPDHVAAVERAEAAGIYTLTVTTTPKAWPRNFALTRDCRFVRAALGLHPQLVAERETELSLWERHLGETRYVGEVGLDASPRFYRSFDAQRRVFRFVLERCAEASDKILSVHSVRSAKTVLDMLEAHLPPDRGRVVLHWFTGSPSEARRASELGCFFSVNAEMVRSDRGRALLAELPLERLLTETDGPFTKVAGRPAEPGDVTATTVGIASARNLAADEVTRAVMRNLRVLLRTSGSATS